MAFLFANLITFKSLFISCHSIVVGLMDGLGLVWQMALSFSAMFQQIVLLAFTLSMWSNSWKFSFVNGFSISSKASFSAHAKKKRKSNRCNSLAVDVGSLTKWVLYPNFVIYRITANRQSCILPHVYKQLMKTFNMNNWYY